MSLELKELAVGIALAVFVLLVFRLARIHRERGPYAVMLVAIALPYVMFAVETHEPDLLRHSIIALIFSAIAFIGARWNLWFVVSGFIAHGVFDGALHYTPLLAPTPGWYGPMCLGFDVAFALGLAGFLMQGERASDMS